MGVTHERRFKFKFVSLSFGEPVFYPLVLSTQMFIWVLANTSIRCDFKELVSERLFKKDLKPQTLFLCKKPK